MKKRILSMFVVVALIFGVDQQAMGQTSLADLIAAAQDGETITMLNDEDLGTTGITISKNLTLNLNGHTLTYAGSSSSYALTILSGTVTITGATGENPGGITCTDSGGAINNLGTLTISGGAFSSTNPSISNLGTLTVTGGSISATGGNASYAIYHFGTAFNLSGNPTINGTTADIFLGPSKVITINDALTAPTTPWTVNLSDTTRPYTFTSGWLNNISTTIPATYFAYYDNTAAIATHLHNNEAEFVNAGASITRGSETIYYETFAEIFANNNASLVDGDVVTLLDDETITTGISIYREVRLDLNGHTLTYTDTQYALTVSSGAEVTITGAEGNTPGGISCTANGWIIVNSGTLTISGGAFSSSNPSIDNHGTLTVEGGSITSSNNNDAIYNRGSLTVNGGSITGYDGINSYGTNPSLTITGGSITATNEHGNAILIQTGTFNLSGNPTLSATGTGDAADICLKTGMVINIPAALTAPASAWTVYSENISGAPTTPYTFTTGFSTYCLDGTDVADPASYFACTTANITTRLTSGEAEFFYARASITRGSENPTILYYLTQAAALADANDGDVIKLLADETITTGLTVNNSITLDLNGHTLTYTGTGTAAITVSANKTVTITGAEGDTPGGISCTNGGICINNAGTLTISRGSFSTSGVAIHNKGGTLTVNGGTISGAFGGIFNNGTAPVLTVTGGSISATEDDCPAINIVAGTFNLSGNPTLSATATGSAINLSSGMVINIDAALSAPASAWTVYSENIETTATTPYIFTSGWSTYCLTPTDAVADPADYFAYYNNTAAITTRLSSTGEAEFANAGASITRGGVNLYYETFAEIFADANNYANGDVIKLLADEDLGTTGITISKNLTLDLNGHTLTYTGTERALTVNNYKTVIIQDTGTGENPGGITSPSGTAIYNDSGASLTVTGGTISGRACITNWGDLNVTGGSFSATGGVTWSAISIQTGTFNLSGNPTLTVTNNTSAIYLGHDMVINIPAALTAPGSSPENAWTVNIFNGLPYVFTGDWPSTMSTADPALFFKSRTEGVTTRFVNGTSIGLKKAQFVICSTLTLAKTGNGKVELDGVEPAFEEVTLDMISSWHQDEQNNLMQADLEGFGAFSEITLDEAMTWPKPANCSKAALFYAFDGTTAYYVNYENSDEIQSFSGEFTHNDIYELMNNGLKVYYTTGLTYPDGVTATTTDGVYIVDSGTELTVKATPNKNNYFKNWTVDNVDEADDISVGVKTYTIDAMGTENVSLTANFAAYPKLTLAANPVAGGKVELADITDGGYSINVKYDDVDYPFPTMTTFPYYINQADLPDIPTNIQTDYCDFQGATWDDTNHRLVINAPFNDKITLYFDNWTKSYDITCTANEPILPDGVTKVTTLVDGSEAFAQDEYHNYKGNLFTWSDEVFENVVIDYYPISITPQDDADAPVFMTSVELTKSSGDFANLAVVKPSSGVTTSMSGNTLTITVPENTTEVEFKTTSGTITLSGVTVNYAAVTPVEGEYFVEPGTAALNLKATAAAIYHTVGWTNATVNNTDITKATVTVTEDVTVTTNFELDPVLTLVADPTTGGTVEFANGLDPFAEITADMIPNWAGDNTDLSAADLPGFVPLKQDDAKNWSNVPAEGVSIVLFEIQNGYFNNAQYQDGECVGNSVTYYSRNGVLSEINNSGHRVFYTIASLPAGVNAKGNGQYYVEPGTQVTLKATPAAIHHLVSWSDNVTVNGTDNTIATITVNDATTVTATFAEDPTLTVASTTGGTVALDGIEEVTLSKALDNGSTVQINWHGTSDVGDLTATFINNNGTFTKTAVNDEDNMNNICLEQDNNNLILSGDNPHVSGKMRITINTSAKTYSITKDVVWTNYDFTLTSVVVNGAVFTPDGEDLVGGIIMPVGVTTTTTEGVYNVAPGSDVTVKATAVVVDNYHFDKWTDENDAPYTGTDYTIGYSDYAITSPSNMFPAKSTITFSMGTDDMTMKGNFEKFSVTVPAGKSVTYYTDIKFKVTDANAAIYTISSVSGSEAVLSDVITVAPANTPLLIHNSSNENKTFDIIPTMEDAASVTVSSQFKGTATAKTTADTDIYGPWNWAANTKYYGFNGTNFVWINAAGDVAAHRCWLETSTNSAPILTIDWDGNATGIKQVDSLQFSQRECGVAKTVESYYDLNGRKLQSKPTKKGVYILNGRKMVVK